MQGRVGSIVEFHYAPRIIGEELGGSTFRRVLIRRLHDLRVTPLFLDAFLRRPYLFRTRWRMQGFDFCRLSERNFYDYASEPCRLQLGIFDPASGRCLELIGAPYEQDKEGIEELIGTCKQILADPTLSQAAHSIAIFAAA
jgi:hypothetical protein